MIIKINILINKPTKYNTITNYNKAYIKIKKSLHIIKPFTLNILNDKKNFFLQLIYKDRFNTFSL